MNIFLIREDPYVSAVKLFGNDPLRANKQIVECTQLLAFVEITKRGYSRILTVRNTPYHATQAQLHHPITKHMCTYRCMYNLCWDVLNALLQLRPEHACRKSLYGSDRYLDNTMFPQPKAECYLVCRKNHPIVTVTTRAEYAELMLDYMTNHKWSKP